jgi:hyperosmotically inducible periplasmic protein
VIRRLFALIVLLLLVGAGLYVWKLRPDSIGAVGDSLGDVRMAASVKAALGLAKDLDGLAIDVSVSSGEVRLRGRVPSELHRRRAVGTAEAVPDVRRVIDDIEVDTKVEAKAPGRSIGESLDDQALEVSVKLALSLRKELSGADISVRSFRRRVTLSGEVANAAQRELAATVVAGTSGVSSVDNTLRLRGPGAPNVADAQAAAEAALGANANLAIYRLRVRQDGGRLVLEGRVRSGAERDLAGLLASSAAGRPVENFLQLSKERR